MKTIPAPLHETARRVAAWLRSLPSINRVIPVTVTIGKVQYPGAYYRSRLKTPEGSGAYLRGERDYTKTMIYLVGDLPAAYVRRKATAFHLTTGGGRRRGGAEWYVASYGTAKVAADPTKAQYHPFGASFQLAPWNIPGEAIDKYEPKPYTRVPATVRVVSAGRSGLGIAGPSVGEGISRAWQPKSNPLKRPGPWRYVIDLDERGTFSAHVENSAGREVWSASTEDEEDGEFWPVRDGFMKHGRDLSGLTEYLRDMKIMPAGTPGLVMGNGLRRRLKHTLLRAKRALSTPRVRDVARAMVARGELVRGPGGLKANPPASALRRQYGEPIKVWRKDGFQLKLYETREPTGMLGRTLLAYEFSDRGKTIFTGDRYKPAPAYADDSLAAVYGLLSFLSLKPGDTDDEYFKDYTPEQIAWRDSGRAEELGLLVFDGEERLNRAKRNPVMKKNPASSITNKHLVFVAYFGATNTRGSRIVVTSYRFPGDKISFSYDSGESASAFDQAAAVLRRLGYTFSCSGEGFLRKPGYIIGLDQFVPLRQAVKREKRGLTKGELPRHLTSDDEAKLNPGRRTKRAKRNPCTGCSRSSCSCGGCKRNPGPAHYIAFAGKGGRAFVRFKAGDRLRLVRSIGDASSLSLSRARQVMAALARRYGAGFSLVPAG